MSGALLGMRAAEIRRKFDEIVAFSEVERFLDTPLKHYSSGMRIASPSQSQRISSPKFCSLDCRFVFT